MRSILTVTTASDTYDLSVLATLRTEFGITDNTENAKLAVWLTQASHIAASYCKRVFAQETLTETFRPDQNRGLSSSRRESLILARRPITSVTSVTIDDVALTSVEYEYDADAGILYRLDTSGYRSCWYCCKSIIVVYVAGYELLATLPYDVERAVIMMVRDMRADQTRDPNLIEQEIPGVIRNRWWADGQSTVLLPPEISGLLDPYRNVWVG